MYLFGNHYHGRLKQMSGTLDPQTTDSIIVTGNTTHTMPENRVFYPALDGLRAVAFLMVFGQHYLQIPWGWTGVDLFFVLSGFLITGILFDTRNDVYRVRNFYIRRTLRIFPLYYGVMLSLFCIEPLMHWQWNWKWLVWPVYLGNYARFIHPYSLGDPLQRLADFQPVRLFGHRHLILYLGHFWSLCVEEQFYIIWPWVVFWIRDRKKLSSLCAVTLPFCLGMRIFAQHLLPHWELNNEILYRATPFRVDALLLGGFISLVQRGHWKQAMFRVANISFPILMSLVILWTFLAPNEHLWQRPYLYPDWEFTWGLSVIDITSALLILVAIQPRSFVHKVLSFGPLRWIGRISYGAYVLHDIPHAIYTYYSTKLISQIAIGHQTSEQLISGGSTVVAAFVGLLSTLFLAWLSFRFIESPFLDIKKRWTIRSAN